MGNCNKQKEKRSSYSQNEIQSIIFYRNKIYKKEIVCWNLKRSMAYMAQRNWMWIKPPDESKQNQIRLHIEPEDKYEALDYQDVGSGICIVFGRPVPPEPRRKYINIGYNKSFKKKSNIHTLSSIS